MRSEQESGGEHDASRGEREAASRVLLLQRGIQSILIALLDGSEREEISGVNGLFPIERVVTEDLRLGVVLGRELDVLVPAIGLEESIEVNADLLAGDFAFFLCRSAIFRRLERVNDPALGRVLLVSVSVIQPHRR